MGFKLGGAGASPFVLQQNANMNITPFVDVLLVLIIIFMLAIPLATVSIKLDLPPTSGHIFDKPALVISVQAQGHIFVGDREVALGNLDSEVRKAMTNPAVNQGSVAIRGGRNVPYREFLSVLNTLQNGGYDNVGLIVENLA